MNIYGTRKIEHLWNQDSWIFMEPRLLNIYETRRVEYLWNHNRLVSQMRTPLAACCEPAGKLQQLCKVLYVFEHKTQYLLIHAPYARILAFWHISHIPPMISKSQICFNTATFCTVSTFMKYC